MAQGAAVSASASPTREDLETGFEAFVAASRRLERSYEELKARAEALEREVVRLDKLAGLSELALGVAHEIKNPLNGALGFAELLLKTEDLATAKRYSTKIHAGLLRVDEIVKALLAFAQPKERSERPVSVLEATRRAASAAGIAFQQVTLRDEAHELVDSGALETVLGNLFRNSREAAGAGVALTVEVGLEGAMVVLRVRDDGPGVRKELGAKVFEPFVSTKERGTGLGLALAQRVLSFLGGSLDLTNPGVPGACFEIRVPRRAGRTAKRTEESGAESQGAAR